MLRAVVVASFGVAALSLLVPSTPTTDSWGWIVWGREVADLDLNTAVGGSPAWKPLPVFFTLVFSPLGEAAPDLWLWTARAADLVAAALAFRLAHRLAGPWAGAVAAVTLLLAGGWMRGAAHGHSEGLVAAALLLAFDSHLDGRRRAATALLVVAALARPEAGVLLAVYVLHGWRREKRSTWVAGAALAVILLAWIGADWWGSGEPFHAGETARSVDADLAWHEVVARGAALAGAAVLVLAALSCVFGWRRRDGPVFALAGCIVAWTVLVCALVAAGWPASPRFLMPAVAGACVLAGVGAVRAVHSAGTVRARRLGVAAVIMLALLTHVLPRAKTTAGQLAVAQRRAVLESDLRQAARAAAVPLRRCGAYALPADLGWLEGAVAWELDVPLERVGVVRRTRALPAAIAPLGPVLVLEQRGRTEPLMSRASRRDRVIVYRTPASARCVTLFSPLSARPEGIGGEPVRIRLLHRVGDLHAWSIERRQRDGVSAEGGS